MRTCLDSVLISVTTDHWLCEEEFIILGHKFIPTRVGLWSSWPPKNTTEMTYTYKYKLGYMKDLRQSSPGGQLTGIQRDREEEKTGVSWEENKNKDQI